MNITQVQRLVTKLELPNSYFDDFHRLSVLEWRNQHDQRRVGEYLLREAFERIRSKFGKIYAASQFVDVQEARIHSMFSHPSFDIVQAADSFYGRQQIPQHETVWWALGAGMSQSQTESLCEERVYPLTRDEQHDIARLAFSSFVESEMRMGATFATAVRRLPAPRVGDIYSNNRSWGQRPEYVELPGAMMLQGRVLNHRLGNTCALNNKNTRNNILRRALF
jgi:hypothetical protein